MLGRLGVICRRISGGARIGERVQSARTVFIGESAARKPLSVQARAQSLIRPIIFSVGIGTVSFGIAAIVHDKRERERLRLESLRQQSVNYVTTSFGSIIEWFSGSEEDALAPEKPVAPEDQTFWATVKRSFNSRKESEKTVLCIMAANAIIFGLWQVPILQPLMRRHFLSSSSSSRLMPLLTSFFSHEKPLHFAFNMAALYSFGIPLCDRLGSEAFCAFFFSAGATSSVVSHAFRVLSLRHASSLGASGAIFALFTAATVSDPLTSVAFVFLPTYVFAAKNLLLGLVCFDLAGLIFRFRALDHAAHLGGVFFGWFYLTCLEYYLKDFCDVCVSGWNTFIGSPDSN